MTISAASLAQMAAAHPDRNTWLLANAGSGKTKVLTDRVARLLLNGVEPQHILCLTYTKAAASEMQNRLFLRLGAWAMKPDEDLRRDLVELGEEELAAPRLARARQLFARAIETPGGLRIQTIHSFCASLLRRFPLEAGVPPGFTEMDDRAARLMRSDIVEEMADRLAPEAVRRVTEVYSGEDFTKLIEQIARHRAGFARPQGKAEVWQMFGLADGFTAKDLLSEIFLGDEVRWLPQVIGLLAAGSSTDVKAAEKLGKLDLELPSLSGLEELESVLLFGVTKDPEKSYTAKISDFPTKDTRAKLGDLTDPLHNLMARVEAGRQPRLALSAAEKTLVLHQFAAAFLPVYAARKAARGLLDFEDLIDRARSLLTDPARAAWVLYRLDGGIEHILVDEAQDTSPEQWELIESLADELTAGQGASNRQRTLFVVGDKKQSIYSFQGADVAAFDRKRDFFRARLADGAGLVERTLSHSFRSSPAILTVVDQTFTPAERDAIGGESSHLAFNETLPGRVDVWPVVESPPKPEPGVWFEPLDLPHPEDAEVRLARELAERIKALVEGGEQIPVVPRNGGRSARPVRYGDFLILVQRRSALFHEIIRACKALNLPIAGADRLRLGGEMAVKDLSALLAFLDTPEDDLSLAATLRSPLCGWSEAELFKLAQGRKGYLWQALRDSSGHAETVDFLNDLRGQADFLRPYDLIERVLHRHDGRRKLLARLGAEAQDGIDELLSQALAYEVSEVPSLTGFLVWMETDDVEVKRQLDGEGHQIRVMTVHGAKGLEAEIVILPDTGDRKPPEGDELLRLPDKSLAWKVPKDDRPHGMTAAHSDVMARALAERLRLLYVAMTRARCWLIIVAKGEVKKPDCWYNLVRAGVDRAGAERLEGSILRHSLGDWPQPLRQADAVTVPVVLPDWVNMPARDTTRDDKVLSPSNLGGAKALPGEPANPEADIKARGTALHLLLERLPPLEAGQWAEMAAALIPDPALATELLAEARLVLEDTQLSRLFARDTLAEVGVTAPWAGRVLTGSIDRLLIAPDRVLIIDYKSNAVIPERPDQVPEGILRQMGAYAHMLGQIYPGRRIDVAILWTRGPQLMPLDPEIVRDAFGRTAIP